MKKTIFGLVAIIIFLTTSAFTLFDGGKTCKVAGTTGSVEVFATGSDDGTITIDFSNDTDIDVNVRYTVTYNCGNSSNSISGIKRVSPHSSATVTKSICEKRPYEVKVSQLSGEKCSN